MSAAPGASRWRWRWRAVRSALLCASIVSGCGYPDVPQQRDALEVGCAGGEAAGGNEGGVDGGLCACPFDTRYVEVASSFAGLYLDGIGEACTKNDGNGCEGYASGWYTICWSDAYIRACVAAAEEAGCEDICYFEAP